VPCVELLTPHKLRMTLDHSTSIQKVERAFASFHAAVAESYGMAEATRAGSDWIEEFRRSCKGRSTDYREVTVVAALRLASRILPRPQSAPIAEHDEAIPE